MVIIHKVKNRILMIHVLYNTKLNHMKLLRLNCFFYLQKYQFGMFPNMAIFPGCEAYDDISFSSSSRTGFKSSSTLGYRYDPLN